MCEVQLVPRAMCGHMEAGLNMGRVLSRGKT